MPVAERAKQFMPFAALRGLPEALAAKEKTVVPKVSVTEDFAEELDRRMHLLKCGEPVNVVYYADGEYLKMTGLVSRIDTENRVLTVVGTRIPFADIADLFF